MIKNKTIHLNALHTTIFPNLFKALIFKWNHYTGFSIRASSQQNSPAISRELVAYFSLEITPQKAKI